MEVNVSIDVDADEQPPDEDELLALSTARHTSFLSILDQIWVRDKQLQHCFLWWKGPTIELSRN